MASSKDFSEWSREEKDAFAKKRMQEMKLKNEMLMQRHAEVLEDKHRAEHENSAIKAVLKKEKSLVIEEVQNKIQSEREWDRGKADLELWNSPDYYDSHPNRKGSNWRTNRREDSWTNSTYTQSKNNQQKYDSGQNSLPKKFGFGTGADWGADRREDNWRNSTYTQSKNVQQKYDDYGQNNFSNRTGNGNNRYKSENSGVGGSNYDKHYTRGRSWGNRGRGASYAFNEQNRSNYSRDNGKKYDHVAHSNSSFSDPDTRVLDNSKSPHAVNTWSDNELAENQQSRVKNWINSISSSDSWDQGNDSKNTSKDKGKGNRGLPNSNLQHNDTWDNVNYVKPTSTLTKNQSSDRGFKQNSYSAHNSYKQGHKAPGDQHNFDKSDFKRQDDNRKSFEKNKKYVVHSSKSNTECHAQRFSAQSNVKGMYNNQKVQSSFKSKHVDENDTWGDIENDYSKSNDGWLDSAQNCSSNSWKQCTNDVSVTQGSKNVNCDADEYAEVDQAHIFRNTNSGTKSVERNSKFDSAKKEFSNSWKQTYRTQNKNSKTDEEWECSAKEEYKNTQHVTRSIKNENYVDEYSNIDQSQTFKKTNIQRKKNERSSNTPENNGSNSWKKNHYAQNSDVEGWGDSTEQENKINKHSTQAPKCINDVDEWANIDQSEEFKKKNSQEKCIVQKHHNLKLEGNECPSGQKQSSSAQNDYSKSDEGWLDSNEKEHASKQSEINALENVMHGVDEWAGVDQSEFNTNCSVKNTQKDPSFDYSCCDNESTLMVGGNAERVESALERTYDDDGFINDRHSKFFEGKEINLGDDDMIRVVILPDNPSQKVQPLNDTENISECNFVADSEIGFNPDSCFTSHNSIEGKVDSTDMSKIIDVSGINQDIIVESKDLNTANTKTTKTQNAIQISTAEGNIKCEEHACTESSQDSEKNILHNNEISPKDCNPTSETLVTVEQNVEVPGEMELKDEGVRPDMATSNESTMAKQNSVNCKNTEMLTSDPCIGDQVDNLVLHTENVSQSCPTGSSKSINISEFLPIFDAGFSVEGEHGGDKSLVKQKHIEPNQCNLEEHFGICSKEESNTNCVTEQKESPLQLNENSQTDNENASALTQSDDGGWSTVSDEAESNAESIDDDNHNINAVKDLHE